MNVSVDVFSGADTHPADDARTTAIGLMLAVTGHEAEAAKIAEIWKQLVGISGHMESQEYEMAYPKAILEQLAAFLVKACRNLGLAPYGAGSQTGDLYMTGVLNTAWQEFHLRPDSFSIWERQQIDRVRTELGL